jgi:hypothetical protein
MVIASENRAMEYHRVANTCRSPESPEQRPIPPGRISAEYLKAWWGGMNWDKALADFKKPVACGATGFPCLRAARAITPGTTTRSSAQNGHKHGSPGKAP